jgi:predicted amidohydrolase YtcJ
MRVEAILLLGVILLAAAPGRAQQAPQAPQGQQDMVLYNGKIVTVSDHSFTSNLGTVAEAMHVRDGKVLHVGTNATIRPMAGAGTRQVDLRGRTVIPGLILTHEHPWDWTAVTPPILKKVVPDQDVIIRTLEGSPEENQRALPAALADAVRAAKPGQWIYFVFTLGRNYEFAVRGNGNYGRSGLDPKVFDALDGKRITQQQLDMIAPNNPVVLRDVFVSVLMNQKAIDESRKIFPTPDVNPFAEGGANVYISGFPFQSPMRWMFQDVILRGREAQLTEIMRLGLEYWAGYGLTAYASNLYAPSNLRVFRELDRRGQMPIRSMWTWNWRPDYFFADPMMLTDLATRVGEGSDYLWNGGGIIAIGGGCTQAEPLASSRLMQDPDQMVQQRRRACLYAPGTVNAKLLYEYIKAGGRFINMHTVGDEDIDNMLKIIVQASRDAGMTDDEIRAKRHGMDHGVMWPRPDQIPVLKQLGIMAGGDGYEVLQASPAVFEIYGERGASWVVPKKRLVEGGIYNSLEVDRALPTTNLSIFSASMAPLLTRRAWDGKVYASDQAVDRQTMLKIATIWGAHYLLRENVIGSLEPGKWADFAVLDRDYLTVPLEDIANTRVLMTVVGGKVIHLAPSVARENGMQPAGAMVTLGPAAQW